MNQAAVPFMQVQQIIVGDDCAVVAHSAHSSQLWDLGPRYGNRCCILPRHHADAGRPWWQPCRSFGLSV